MQEPLTDLQMSLESVVSTIGTPRRDNIMGVLDEFPFRLWTSSGSNPSKLRPQTPLLLCHTPHPSMLRRMTMTMIRMPRTTTYLYWPGVHCVVYVVVVLVTSSYSLSVLFMFDTCTTCTYIYQHVVPSYPIAITGVGEQVPGNLRSLARPRRPKRPHPKRTPTPWRASRQPSRNRRATRLRGSCRTNRIIFLLKIKRGSGGI